MFSDLHPAGKQNSIKYLCYMTNVVLFRRNALTQLERKTTVRRELHDFRKNTTSLHKQDAGLKSYGNKALPR